jgi:hypothetical protein
MLLRYSCRLFPKVSIFMTETLFDPPHNATPSEAAQVRSRYASMPLEEALAREAKLPHDARMTTIYELYALRGDTIQMQATLERIEDPVWRRELGYRDVVPTSYFEET